MLSYTLRSLIPCLVSWTTFIVPCIGESDVSMRAVCDNRGPADLVIGAGRLDSAEEDTFGAVSPVPVGLPARSCH